MLQSNLENKYPPQFEELMREIDEELEFQFARVAFGCGLEMGKCQSK